MTDQSPQKSHNINNEEPVSVAGNTGVSTAVPEVSTATPMTPPTTTSVFKDEDIFLVDALAMLSDKTKLQGVAIKEIHCKESKRSDWIAAQFAKDVVTARLQMEEREMYTVEERSRLLAEYFENRKKQLAAERSAAIRNKPPTRTQLRSLMMTYLKYIDFVPIGSEEDERMIEKMNKKAAGIDEEEVLEEHDSTKVEVKQEGHTKSTRKRSSRRLKMKETKRSKRQKTDSDLEEEKQLKDFLKIVSDEEGEVDYEVLDKRYPIVDWESKFYHSDRYGKPHDYYKVIRSDGSLRYIKTFTEMVSKFNRLDFIELYNLVMQRFAATTPEGIDLILWGSLRTMFEANADDDLWKNQEKWILKSCHFYKNSGVHILMLEDSTEFFMLAERRYPLIKETLERMLALRLIAECESEVVFDLLRFIQKQIDKYGSYDGSEKNL
ncbi:hypothetical protein Tco_1036487, partial [Tanacetum coccineum]